MNVLFQSVYVFVPTHVLIRSLCVFVCFPFSVFCSFLYALLFVCIVNFYFGHIIISMYVPTCSFYFGSTATIHLDAVTRSPDFTSLRPRSVRVSRKLAEKRLELNFG
jgi:hypothetical protein